MLLGIVKACEGGIANSELEPKIAAMQQNNLSVYAPVTLCRMLERAGALTLEIPQAAETAENVEEGVEYLQIEQAVDPIWTATEDGLAVYGEFSDGAQFRDIVMNRDAQYLDIYRAIMQAAADGGRTKAQIEEVTDAFPIVKKPRRFGGHFIDMLERCDALEWRDHAWRLTKLGQRMLNEISA